LLLVVVLVVVLPLAWVWTAGTLETGSIRGLRADLQDAATTAVGAWSAGGDLEVVARRHGVRLRVLDPAGALVVDHDRSGALRVFEPVTDPFYGPGGGPDLAALDAALPALAARPESRGDPGEVLTRCEIVDRGLLLVCAAAVRTPDGDQIGRAHV
jgi:hypothetical protein